MGPAETAHEPSRLSEGALPLATGQREVWLDQQAWPGSAHLNIGGVGVLSGALDASLMQQALTALAAETEALRLVPQADGTQRLLTQHEPLLEQHDFSAAADPSQAMRDWENRRIRDAFELGTGHAGKPPWRFALLRGGPRLHHAVILFHHTVMDGWGTTLVMRRWSEHYNRLAQGAALPPAGESYLRFIEDAQKYPQSPAHARDAAYWRSQLGAVPPPLIERREAQFSQQAQIQQKLPPSHLLHQALDAEAYGRLAREASSRGLSPFIAFLAALALYLSRCTGQHELVIGVPCLNRAGQKYRRTPGMFVGVMPLVLRSEPGQTAMGLLAHVAHQLQEGLRHARYPMSELGRQLQLMRQGRDSLVEVLISFERQDYSLAYGEAHLVEAYQLFNGWARYPLAVTVCEFGAEAEEAGSTQDPMLVVEASSACWGADDAALLGPRLWWIAQQLLFGDALRDIAEIDLMPASEFGALTRGLHKDLARLADPAASFVDQFEQQAALRPLACALVWDELQDGLPPRQLSYGELDRQAERLAATLHAAGAGPERIVALALPRSPELVVALLAVAKTGAAFLPMNPEMPPARLAEILADSQALALLLPFHADPALAALHALVLHVKPVQQGERRRLQNPPAWARPGPEGLAYVLYTSGSTGGPKGVLMPHASLTRRLAWLARTWGLGPEDRAAQTTQPSFDPALIELLLPLTVGASIALPPPGRLHPRRLADFILRHGATFCALVPSTLAGLLNGLSSGLQTKDSGSGHKLRLRVACCGGEVLPAELSNRFLAETGARLYNVYGPTEAAIFATAWPCAHRPVETALPLGRPVDDTRIYVLDARLRPLPFGVAGEIYIGGGALARGYLGRPDLDDAVFLPDPFQPGERIYRTGDRGWLDAQGLLHFGGRADRQIKLRGYRIEPGDIELACLAVPGVEQALVQKVELDGSMRLHAWIGAAGGTPSAAELLQALRERLPDYMLPSSFSMLPALPLTLTGKIDARALPPPTAAGSAPRAPRAVLNSLEQELLALWRQALNPGKGKAQIAIHDNFFDLGGDSLAALDIFSALEERLRRPLSLQLISEHPTIEQLAEALARPQPLPGVIQPLGSGGAAVPLYVAASGYGDVLRFQALARALHGLLDVHMLQPPREQLPSTPRELAERYADSIAARGLAPGWLAGFSVAGVAALETVRVLQERGQPPLGLLLLDTIHPDAALGGTSSWRFLSWLVHRLHVEELSMNGRRLGAMFSDPGLVAQVLALRSYRCEGIEGLPVLLVQTSGLVRWRWMFFSRWRRLMPQLRTMEVDGLHGSMFEPARVAGLARVLQQFAASHAAPPTESAR